MSTELPKKRRGRPSGSAKKSTVQESTVESLVDNDVIESPPPPTPGVNIDYGFHFLDSEEDYGDKFKIALSNFITRKWIL